MAAVQKQVNGASNRSVTSQSFSYSSSITSSSHQINVQRVTVLREVTNKVTASYKRELDVSSVEKFESTSSSDVLLDYIAGERLRCMPHSGSRYDLVLRRAEAFAVRVAAFSQSVSEAVMCSTEAAQLIWGSCLLILQLGEHNLDLLDKLFSVYYKFGLAIEIFAQHGELLLESPAAQKCAGKAYANMLQVVANSSIYYAKKATNGSIRIKSGEFEQLFGRVEESFYQQRSAGSTALWSTSVEHLPSSDRLYDVESVRRYLAPQDRVTQALMSGRISSRHHRAEFTCEWATKQLTEFARSKDNVALISGKDFSGKSVLAGWIADRMRNTKGRLGHEIISYDIDVALKDQTNPLSLIQGLVLQVFDKFVGDISLYQSVCASLRATTEGKSTAELEETLWSALNVGLTKAGKLLIIVDGIDQLGDTAMTQTLEHLHKVTASHQDVKAIALSRPLAKAAPKNTKLWTIEPTNIKEDIVHFTHERLASSQVLSSLSYGQRHSIVEKISTSANGSFAWADIVIELVLTQKSLNDASKMIDSLPKSVNEVIDRLVATVDISSKETRSILAWMLAAQRPLLLTEIKSLFEIDFSTMTYAERFTDIGEDVRKTCGGLVDITDGIVRFRSLAIRYRLLELAASVKDFSNNTEKNVFPFHIQEASYDLCLRTLAYVKLVLDRQYHISTVFLTNDQLIEVFDEHAFLEYSSRYWLTHFRNSPMHKYPGEHKLTSGFKQSFPTITSHSLIEGTCVRAQYPLKESHDLLLLSLTLRKTVLGETSEPVLQTLLNVANLRQHLSTKDATNIYYHQAFKLARTVLGDDSEVTISTAHRYIDSITTFTKSTEIEEVLTYVVKIQKKTVGVSHKTTITYMTKLASYYVFIKETTKAATLYREIYEITVSQYGVESVESQQIYQQLKTVSSTTEIQQITQEQHNAVVGNVAVYDTRRVTSTRDMIMQYEKENNLEKAEETMVNYWREISEASHASKDVKVQEQQVDATFEYARFLQRQKRVDEATTILNGLYLELEKSTTFNQSKVTWIQQIGEHMKAMGSTSAARNVFSSLWSYYRSSGQQTTKEAQSVAQSLTETATTSMSSTTTVESQEEILREILETTSMTSTTIDITTTRTCQQLISVYSRQEKHEEIIEVSRDILQRLWPTVLTGQKDVKMPTQYVTEAVEIAIHLARSYFTLHYVDESTQTYVSIFQGYRSSPKIYTKELITSGRHLITHYQNIYRHKDALNIYQALYEALVEVYGPTHQQVIEILYEKADLEVKQNRRREAQVSYDKIYTTLKGNSEFCHKEGIRAALALCKMYEKEQKWEQARGIYQILWETFLKKGQDYSLGVEFVNQIFDRYLFILEKKTTVDYKTLRALASQYRETCIKFYGADSERTLSASMNLASLDEREQQYQEEAISIYEFILNTYGSSKKISTASTFAAISTAKRQLAKLYSSRSITHDRAQSLYSEEFESAKSKHGPTHDDTLYWLGLLVTCYKKRNTTESNKAASDKLQDAATDIILTEKDTNKLHQSAANLAQIYQTQKITSPTAQEFLIELRRHVVTGESNLAGMKGKTADRRSYIFIVAFEEAITSGQFSVIMSELMTEVLLTQSYLKAKKSAPFDTVFSYGVRLRAFLKSKNRSDVSRIEEELLDIFTHKIVGNRQVDKAATRQFFDIAVTEHGRDQQDVTVLKTVSEAILRSFNENQFQRGYSLAIITDAYMHHYDSFRSQSKVEIAFRICLYLVGQNTKKCTDAKLNQHMMHLSRVLLKEVLQAARSIHLHLITFRIEQLNSLVGLLGEQQNYEDLEASRTFILFSPPMNFITNYLFLQWILHDLWTSRHTQSSWPPSTIVSIGRKLVECRFSMGNKHAAIQLAEDICYNLRRVWGPLDKTTLEMTVLLAELYGAVGDHTKAMGVHEEILQQIISDEIDMDQVSSSEEAEIVVKHLDLLRRSFARNAAHFPADKDVSYYAELLAALSAQVGGESAWKSAGNKTESVDKWAGTAKGFKEDKVGVWNGVGGEGWRWEFLSEGEKKRTHINALRRSIGRISGDWSSQSQMNGSTNGVKRNGFSVGVKVNGD